MLAGVPPKLRAKAEARLDLVAVWAWTRGDGDVRLGLSRDVARDLKTAQTHHAEPLYVALEVYGAGLRIANRPAVCWQRFVCGERDDGIGGRRAHSAP